MTFHNGIAMPLDHKLEQNVAREHSVNQAASCLHQHLLDLNLYERVSFPHFVDFVESSQSVTRNVKKCGGFSWL